MNDVVDFEKDVATLRALTAPVYARNVELLIRSRKALSMVDGGNPTALERMEVSALVDAYASEAGWRPTP